MKLVVSGGGTGGHFFPALAVLEEAKRKGIETLYVGATRGIENRLRDRIPSETVILDVYPLRGVPLRERVRAVKSFLNGFLELRSRLGKDFRSLIFGGYVSVPLGISTVTRGRSLFVHEQNSVPSSANRLFSLVAKKVFITFEYTRRFFKGDHVIRTGLPVRREILEAKISKERAREILGFDPSSPVFLFMGGSQGARFVNSLGVDFAKKTGIQTLIISGERDHNRVKDMVKGLGGVKVFPFRTDMGVVYSAVDVAVVRAGSSTLTELSIFGIPALMIPYPFAVGDHQYYNAKEIEELGGGFVLRQEEATLEKVIGLVDRIVGDRGRMSERIKSFANPEASRVVLKEITED